MFQVPVKPPAVTAGDLQFAGLAGHGPRNAVDKVFKGYAACMRAALYRTTGPAAEVLHVEEIERPQPGPGRSWSGCAPRVSTPPTGPVRG